MSTLSDIGAFAWEALWLPVFVWTASMGALLLLLKALPTKWIQVHSDLRLAGMMALVVGVVTSWILPLTPDSAVAFLTVSNPLAPVLPAVSSSPEVLEPAATFTAFTTVGVLTLAAFLATVLGVIRLIVGGFRLQHVLSRSGKAEHVERVHSSVEVVLSEETQVAFSAGILRRRIVLPSSISNEDLPAVLAHELSHHTNGDIFRTWVSHCVRALFFFHPLVHYIHHECQLLTEIACDRRTLNAATLEPRAYADLLVRSTPQSNRNAPVLALAHSPSQLRKRITAMKNTIELPFSGSQLALLGTVFVFLLGGLVGCTDFQIGPTEPDVALEGYDLVMELPEGPVSAKGALTSVEQFPTLIGGLSGLQSTLVYPEIAKNAGVSGRVFLQFVVQPDGSVTDAVVTSGIGAGCDEAALTMVQNAKFIPGVHGGMRVPVKMSLPVTFKLSASGEPITDPEKLKSSSPPLTSRFPAVDVKDVKTLESMEDVDFEYDIVMVSTKISGYLDVKGLEVSGARLGADYIIKPSPKNATFFEQRGMKGGTPTAENSVILLRRKR